jgi:hypothetical protein
MGFHLNSLTNGLGRGEHFIQMLAPRRLLTKAGATNVRFQCRAADRLLAGGLGP